MNDEYMQLSLRISELERKLSRQLDYIHWNLINVMFKACSSTNMDLLHNLNHKEKEINET